MTTITPISPAAAQYAALIAATRTAAPAGATVTGVSANARVSTSFERATLGKSMSVTERFDSLEERFIPSKAKGVDVKLQFIISGKGGGEWYVVIKDGTIKVTKGKGPNPTATLKADAEDYLKIANGEMNKMWAFIRGKLKIDGDKDALKPFDEYFKKA